jgi:hypothetical protein
MSGSGSGIFQGIQYSNYHALLKTAHCPEFDLITPQQSSEGANVLLFTLLKDAVPILEVK